MVVTSGDRGTGWVFWGGFNMLKSSEGVGETMGFTHNILSSAIRPPNFTVEKRRGRGTEEL